jgi:hypothetical protein
MFEFSQVFTMGEVVAARSRSWPKVSLQYHMCRERTDSRGLCCVSRVALIQVKKGEDECV